MADMEILDILRRVRDRIASPDAFAQTFTSVDSDGNPGSVHRPEAVRWNLEGAVMREAGPAGDAAAQARVHAVGGAFHEYVFRVNAAGMWFSRENIHKHCRGVTQYTNVSVAPLDVWEEAARAARRLLDRR